MSKEPQINQLADQTFTLVEKLAEDDAFREAVEADPVTALKDFGIDINEPPAMNELPPKERFQEYLEALKTQGWNGGFVANQVLGYR